MEEQTIEERYEIYKQGRKKMGVQALTIERFTKYQNYLDTNPNATDGEKLNFYVSLIPDGMTDFIVFTVHDK